MVRLLEEITHLISLMQLKVYSFYTTDRKMRAFSTIFPFPKPRKIKQHEKGKRKHMAPKNLTPQLKVKKKLTLASLPGEISYSSVLGKHDMIDKKMFTPEMSAS